MSRNNINPAYDPTHPSAPPRTEVYDEVPGNIEDNGSLSSIPPVYAKQTVITVQPQIENDSNHPTRRPVPINTTQWVSTPRSQLSALRGTDFLLGIEQLEIQQSVQLSTLLGEFKSGNQYKVKVPRAETIFLATETSIPWQRDILGSSRSFSLSLMDPTGQVAFKFTKGVSWGCIPGFLHKLSVECLGPIGTIEQNFTLVGDSFTVYDVSRNPLCYITGPNICCCCISRDSQFQIVSIDGTHQIASLVHNWDNLLVDYTLTLTVTADTSVILKGLLLGASFLLEYLHFERSKKR